MTLWTPELGAERPLYRALADAIGRDVQAGRLRPGDRLPTHRELAPRLGVNVATITRAYAEARRRGLLVGEVGRGTFVASREPLPLLPLASEPGDAIELGINLPFGDPKILRVKDTLARLARLGDRSPLLAGYHALGMTPHRAAGAAWLRRDGLDASPERTVVCGGAQHALAVAFASLAAPGDLVLTEELTYPGMRALAAALHLRLQGLPMDREGLLPDALEAACRRGGVRALYTMPSIQNPTGAVMSEPRRRAVAAIARKHGLPIVEDDTYGFLLPEAPAALATHAPELTTHVRSTSKSLCAGLRIGYLLAPARDGRSGADVERLGAHVTALGWMAAPLAAEIASRWIDDGTAAAIIAWKRRETAARRRIADRLLRAVPHGTHPASPHLWLPLPSPWRGESFAREARRRGVRVSASEAFVAGRAAAPHAVRVCIGTPATRAAVERGVEILAQTLARPREAVRSLV